ncbi:ribonucleotide reductase [Escherichia coli]|uniref:ribonucleotide reductase n=1 Tax=Escherichia coli TaxID=562 RepID=UPI00389084E3
MVPDYEHLHDAYELLWEMPGNDGYLQLVGIMQKFIDQSISANTNYDPSRFPSGKVPMQQLLKDLLTAYKFGVKTLYYQNTRDGAEDAQDDLVPSIQTMAAKAAHVRSDIEMPDAA